MAVTLAGPIGFVGLCAPALVPADIAVAVPTGVVTSVTDELRFSWVGPGFRPGPGGKVISAVVPAARVV